MVTSPAVAAEAWNSRIFLLFYLLIATRLLQLFRALLLQRLMFGKAQAHSLGHLDVAG
jgi:hypothetical protein